jgi:hypothetical protein
VSLASYQNKKKKIQKEKVQKKERKKRGGRTWTTTSWDGCWPVFSCRAGRARPVSFF